MHHIKKVESRTIHGSGDDISAMQNEEEVTNIARDMEMQAIRIQSILKDLMSKSLIGVSIIELLTNKINFLQNTLTMEHFLQVRKLSKMDYEGDFTQLLIDGETNDNNNEKQSKNAFCLLDEQLYHQHQKKYPIMSSIITILNEYPEIIQQAEVIMTECGFFLPACYTYLESLPLLCKRIMDKILMTSTEIHTKSMLFAQSRKACISLREKITDMKKKIKDEKLRFLNGMKIKDAQLATFKKHNMTEKKEAEFKLAFDTTVKMSACNMVLASKKHETKIIDLTKEHKEEVNAFNTTLLYHLTNEKTSRLKRIKRENQLMNWIHKYDFEISIRNGELEVLEKKKDYFLEIKKKIEERLAEIQAKYDIMIFERNSEYEEEMEKKCSALKLDHSIRVLQRMILMMKHRLKIKGSKKSKKRKKKKKLEEDAGAVEA